MRLTFMSSSGGTWGSRLSRELCSESTASAWSVFDFSCWESQLFHWIQLNQIHQIPTGSHMAHLCETVLWHFLSLYTCAYKPVFVVSFGFFGVFFFKLLSKGQKLQLLLLWARQDVKNKRSQYIVAPEKSGIVYYYLSSGHYLWC